MTTPSTAFNNQPVPQTPSSTRAISSIDQRRLAEESAAVQAARNLTGPMAGESGTSPTAPDEAPSTLPLPATIQPSLEDAIRAPLVDPKSIGRETSLLGGVQTWEGQILEIDDGIFSAELVALDRASPSEKLSADFRVDALDAADRAIVAVGDLFYVTSLRVRDRGLLRTKYTIQLRRGGKWTAADIDQIRSRVRQRLEALGDDPS